MFEEKQLLAVQMFLRDQIAKETRVIEELFVAVKEAKMRKAAGQLPVVKPIPVESHSEEVSYDAYRFGISMIRKFFFSRSVSRKMTGRLERSS